MKSLYSKSNFLKIFLRANIFSFVPKQLLRALVKKENHFEHFIDYTNAKKYHI